MNVLEVTTLPKLVEEIDNLPSKDFDRAQKRSLLYFTPPIFDPTATGKLMDYLISNRKLTFGIFKRDPSSKENLTIMGAYEITYDREFATANALTLSRICDLVLKSFAWKYADKIDPDTDPKANFPKKPVRPGSGTPTV